jgi:23S rRNA (uracil1939-C5)-methyltransferase
MNELGKNHAPVAPALQPAGVAPAGTETVVLHGMAHGGEAVGRLPDGRAVFVAGGVPGETVRVRIAESKPRWARAKLGEVLHPSPDRVAAPCPHFGRCGGCQWQHIALPRQRALKREIVLGQLRHLGGLAGPANATGIAVAAASPGGDDNSGAAGSAGAASDRHDPAAASRSGVDLDALTEPTRAVGSTDGFGYRNHATFAIDAFGRACFHAPGTLERVPIDRCLLLHPLLREWHEALPAMQGATKVELRVGTRTGQRLALVGGEPSALAVSAAREHGIALHPAGEGEVTEMIGTERFRISSKAFFQANTEGAEVLVELVLEMLQPTPEDSVLDAYAGVGLFSVPLARRAGRVFSVENNPAAIRDLRVHIKGLPIHVVGVSLEDSDSQLPKRVDLIVADPPREGLGSRNVGRLAAMRPRRLVLVSCDAASLARDASCLAKAGYPLRRAVPVDLFPHTFHVETVALFEKYPAGPAAA